MSNKKRTYELIYLMHRDVTDEERSALQDRLQTTIAEQFEGSILKTESWGKRRLAYEIQKGLNRYNKAYYQYNIIRGLPSMIKELERILCLSDLCIRFLTIRLDDFNPESLISPVVEETVEAAP